MTRDFMQKAIKEQMAVLAETTAMTLFLYNEMVSYTKKEQEISAKALNLRNFAAANSLEEPIHKIVQQLNRIQRLDYLEFYKELRAIGVSGKLMHIASTALYFYKGGNPFFMSNDVTAKHIRSIRGHKYSKEAIRKGLHKLVEMGLLCQSVTFKTRASYTYYPTIKFINILQSVQGTEILKSKQIISLENTVSSMFEIDKSQWIPMRSDFRQLTDSPRLNTRRVAIKKSIMNPFPKTKIFSKDSLENIANTIKVTIKENMEQQAVEDLKTLNDTEPVGWYNKDIKLLKTSCLKFIATSKENKMQILKDNGINIPETIVQNPALFTYGVYAKTGGKVSFGEITNALDVPDNESVQNTQESLLDCQFMPKKLDTDNVIKNATMYGPINPDGVKPTAMYYADKIKSGWIPPYDPGNDPECAIDYTDLYYNDVNQNDNHNIPEDSNPATYVLTSDDPEDYSKYFNKDNYWISKKQPRLETNCEQPLFNNNSIEYLYDTSYGELIALYAKNNSAPILPLLQLNKKDVYLKATDPRRRLSNKLMHTNYPFPEKLRETTQVIAKESKKSRAKSGKNSGKGTKNFPVRDAMELCL